MTNPKKWREHSPYEWQEWANERERVILQMEKQTKLMEIVGLAIGEASMLWSEIPKGVFESTKAKELMLKTVHAIEEVFPPKDIGPMGNDR
jgi:hypothetical protein